MISVIVPLATDSETELVSADPADRFLTAGKTAAAVQAYRDRIASSAAPQPAAWIGLAIALHRLPDSALKQMFSAQLALMFDIHSCLNADGGLRDPIHLAEWLT